MLNCFCDKRALKWLDHFVLLLCSTDTTLLPRAMSRGVPSVGMVCVVPVFHQLPGLGTRSELAHCLSFPLSVGLFALIYMSLCLSVSWSVCPDLCVCPHLCVHLFVLTCVSVCPLCVCPRLCVCLSSAVCLSSSMWLTSFGVSVSLFALFDHEMVSGGRRN